MTPPIRMVSVPVEPTEAMIEAGWKSQGLDHNGTPVWKCDVEVRAIATYRAMLDAAPVREEGGAVTKACADFQEAIDYFEADVADALAEGSERADLWDREVTVNIDALKTVMSAALATREEAPEPMSWVSRVMEVREEGDGFWAACSGCQESIDGYVSTKDYPFSAAFGCQPGGGCSECGGLGVKWDTTDYDAMAASMLADMAREEAGEIDLCDDKVQAGIAWTMRQWGETLGLKTWTMGDGSESVEGDVGAEIHTILVDAGLRDPETNEMAALRAQPQARHPLSSEAARGLGHDDAMAWITKNAMAVRRDNGDMDYSLGAMIAAYEAGKAAQPQAREEAQPVAPWGHAVKFGANGWGFADDEDPDTIDALKADPDYQVIALYERPPAPEAEKLRAAVEAMRGALEWDKERGYRMPYRVRDPLYAAIDLAALQQKGRPDA